MQKKSTFKLFLNSKEYLIPSEFNTINDIKEDIYKILSTTGQYEVKSYVHKKTFQSFIDYWVKGDIPDFYYDRYFIEYIQLSEEFDIMKNLIQLFLKNTSHPNIYSLMANKSKKSQIQSKKADLYNKTNNFKQSIEIIFKNEEVGFNPDVLKEKDFLLYSIEKGDFESVDSITKKKIELNGFSYILNGNDKTAQLYSINKEDASDILIPSTISHELNEYSITSFSDDLFKYLKNVKTIKFDENSILKKLDVNFSSSTLEEISIPDNVFEFNRSWCCETTNLRKVKISPKNKNLIFFDDKFLIGKTNINSDIFDILYFARRDIEEAVIPPFIRIISPFAFNFCMSLKKVEFSGDSNLQIIDDFAFYCSSLASITIPKSVTKISSNAFRDCPLIDLSFSEDSQLELIGDSAFESTSLKSVSIPSKVKKIGKSAFCICNFLSKVEFYENSQLKIIDDDSFNSTALKNIEIPKSVVFIGDSSFAKCQELEKVEFHHDSELLMIGENAFKISTIENIFIPKKVILIGKECFFNCKNLQKVDFDKNSQLKNIDDNAFGNCSITNISIPSSVVRIGEGVFSFCENFESIEFSNNSELRIIDKLAFSQTKIKEIKIPSHVVRLCEKSFEDCMMLKYVEFDEKNSELEVIENFAFSESSIESFIVPPKIKQIQENAFCKCKNFTSFDLSKNFEIKSIPSLFSQSSIKCISLPDNLVDFGKNWCNNTPNLVEVKISPNNKNFIYYENKYLIGKSDIKSDSFDILYFARRDIEEAVIPSFIKIISSSAFNSCDKLTKIDFLDDSQLQKIGNEAFFDSRIEKIKIPKHVTKIGNIAFGYCENLKEIEFSENSELKTIKKSAFCYSGLRKIVIPSSCVDIKKTAFSSCYNLKEVEFAENSEIKYFEDSVFESSPIEVISFPENLVDLKEGWCFEMESLIEIKISPKNKNFIYYDNKYLIGKSNKKSDIFDFLYFARRDIEKAKIPPFVRIISPYAFNCCQLLKEVEFSDDSKLQIIMQNAFIGSSLEFIFIPKNVIEIGPYNFDDTPIQKVEFSPDSMLKILGDYSFYGSQIVQVLIPSNVKIIGKNAFSSCEYLSCVVFEDNSKLNLIDSFAFAYSSIQKIKIPKNVKKICESAFEDCQYLETLDLSECSNLISIEKNAFYGSSIRSVMIPSSVICIDEKAFSNCDNLQIIEFEEESKLKLFNYADLNSNAVIMIPSKLKSICFIESY